jgi:hypothetical protein
MTHDECISTLIRKGFIQSGHFYWWRPGDDHEAKLVFEGDGKWSIRYLND